MYGVFVDTIRVGSVMRFEGNPPAIRWQAYAPREKPTDPENRKGFRTRREATAWLVGQYKETGRAAA